MMEFLDFVLMNGQRICIEIPQKHIDEFYTDIENAMQLGSQISTQAYEGMRATFHGQHLTTINMKQVVGVG